MKELAFQIHLLFNSLNEFRETQKMNSQVSQDRTVEVPTGVNAVQH